MIYFVAVDIVCNVYNWLSYEIVGNSVCRAWEICTFAFPCAVNRVIHDSIKNVMPYHSIPFYSTQHGREFFAWRRQQDYLSRIFRASFSAGVS